MNTKGMSSVLVLLASLTTVLGGAPCADAAAIVAKRAEPMDGAGQDFLREREAMVRDQIAARGVRNAAVLAAMRTVPRHLFVPASIRGESYADYPLPIGGGQTISQPYIVAFMTESLALKAGDKVLEIGTGSGYQAAVLACLTNAVYSLEIDPDLAKRAATVLADAGYSKVRVKAGDGYFGWPEEAPFDAVLVACAADRVPPRLLEQLREGGRLILPLEKPAGHQVLTLFTKKSGSVRARELLDVRFVPMTGEVKRQDISTAAGAPGLPGGPFPPYSPVVKKPRASGEPKARPLTIMGGD